MSTSTSTKKKKPRKRKRGHYITGIYKSAKCPILIHYRSSWERTVCEMLDRNPEVVSYEYESVIIPYLLAGKTRKYYPDFLIRYKSGRVSLVEVKRQDKLTTKIVMTKAQAARQWIVEQKNGWTYEVWTDAVIEAYRKVLGG